MVNRRLIGAQSKIKGRNLENYFINCCRAERLVHFRIRDAGRISPKGQFYRQSQVCDFIVIINGNIWIIDTKSHKKSTRSTFIAPPLCSKLTSTQRQAQDFIKTYELGGSSRCGFLWKSSEIDPFFKYISPKMLIEIKSKSIKKIVPIEIVNIRDLEELNG